MESIQDVKEFIKKEVLDLINRRIEVQINEDINNPFSEGKYIEITFIGHCLGEKSGFRKIEHMDSFYNKGFKCRWARSVSDNLIGFIIEQRLG